VIIVLACAVVVGVESVFLRRRLARLMTIRFRRMYLVWLALVDQILVISVLPDHEHLILDIANLVSYAAAAFFVWSNRRIPGVVLLGAGGGLNLLAIVTNGGTMPASASALRASGWKPQAGHFANSAVVAHPKLAFLGDVFASPRWVPFHDVFSVGDLLIVVAVALLVYKTCARVPVDATNTGAGTDDAAAGRRIDTAEMIQPAS
jgi:Family of unknown function (DUF5317)